MLAACLLTLRQIGDPSFLRPLVWGVLAAFAAFLGLAAGTAWLVGWLAGGQGWLAGWATTLAATLGGLLALGLAIWLFVPVVLAFSGLFLDPVAAAVERRFYPALPPANGAGLGAQLAFNLGLALRFGLLSLAALPLALLVPPFGAVLLWLISTIALGHGLFEGVAQRRLSVPESRRLRRRREAAVLGLGAILAAMALVPGLNLLVPVLGTAAMTHLLHRNNGGMSGEIGI